MVIITRALFGPGAKRPKAQSRGLVCKSQGIKYITSSKTIFPNRSGRPPSSLTSPKLNDGRADPPNPTGSAAFENRRFVEQLELGRIEHPNAKSIFLLSMSVPKYRSGD